MEGLLGSTAQGHQYMIEVLLGSTVCIRTPVHDQDRRPIGEYSTRTTEHDQVGSSICKYRTRIIVKDNECRTIGVYSTRTSAHDKE